MLLKRTILQELLKSAAQHSRSQFGSKLSHGCVHLTESWQRRFLSSGASFSRAISPSVCTRGQAGPLQCHQLCYRPLYGRDAEDVSKPRSLRGPTKSQGLGSPRRTRLARGRAKSLETPVPRTLPRRPSAEIPAQLAMWLLPRGVAVCNFGCSPASLTPFGLRGLKGKGFLCTGCSVCVSRAGHLTSAGAQALCGRLLTPPPCVTRGRGRTRASTAGTFSQSQARCPCLQFASGSALPAAPPGWEGRGCLAAVVLCCPERFLPALFPSLPSEGEGCWLSLDLGSPARIGVPCFSATAGPTYLLHNHGKRGSSSSEMSVAVVHTWSPTRTPWTLPPPREGRLLRAHCCFLSPEQRPGRVLPWDLALHSPTGLAAQSQRLAHLLHKRLGPGLKADHSRVQFRP